MLSPSREEEIIFFVILKRISSEVAGSFLLKFNILVLGS